MCGLAGFSLFNGALLLADWSSRTLDRLSHRGPDDCGLFLDKSSGIGLAHTRLAILDLSPMGTQPMLSVDGSVALVFKWRSLKLPRVAVRT